ncbi:MAG: hypothetical protein M0Z39_00870 [Actinomycetota bacterium]|jgi:hypothetical protein|nr:hypothetical protein [Actinomycetota bacterium]
MCSKSGSTSNREFGNIPEDVLWVVRNGQVLASCVQAKALSKRIFPGRIDKSWTRAAVLFGRLPAVVLGSKPALVAIHLDASLKAIRISTLSSIGVSIPTSKTKVMIVLPEEIVRRYRVAEGDQFELKS